MKKKTRKHCAGCKHKIVEVNGELIEAMHDRNTFEHRKKESMKKKTQWNKIFKLGDKINSKLHFTEKDVVNKVLTYRKRKQIEKEGMLSLKLDLLHVLDRGKRILNTRWFSVWIIKK